MKRVAIASALLLLLPFLARASEAPYVSEIAWAGSAASTSDEWFEICGPAGTDLSGWRIEGASTNPMTLAEGSIIPASGAFVVANYGSDDPKSTLAHAPDLVTTSIALSNSALFVALRDAQGMLIDTAGASGTAPFAGTSGSAKASMSRLLPLQDGALADAWTTATDSSGFDAGAAESGTPGSCPPSERFPAAAATETATATEETAPEPAAPSAAPTSPTSSVRISEIYPAPRSGEQEWVELVNPSSVGEVLDGWALEDGKGTQTPLSGTLLAWGRLVIASPKGSLNNDGDLVVLRDALGRVVDGVAYGGWDTAMHPRVDAVTKGASVIRLEYQDAFDVTTVPTPNAANVLAKEVEEETGSARAEAETQHFVIPAVPAAALNAAGGPLSSFVPKTDPVLALRTDSSSVKAAEDTQGGKRKPASKKATAKKPASRYKGNAYAAVIAVPPGVYSKTKFYVLRGNDMQEVRLSKSPSSAYLSGQRISFVAQAKEDGGAAFLLANPNSIARVGEAASSTFATIDRWPETAGAYRFAADIRALGGGSLEIRMHGIDGDVLLPKALPALKEGDRIEIQGFIAPGARPRVFVGGADALRVLAAAPVENAARDLPKPRLPLPFAIFLTAAAAGTGLIAYLRQERLKRLGLLMQPIEEEAS